MDSALLLSSFERCQRLGVWSRDWEKSAPDATEMLQRAIRAGLITNREDHGMAAGEACFEMGATCGLQTTGTSVHDQVTHLSALSEILVEALRKPQESPWLLAEEVRLGQGPTWSSNAFLDQSGSHLRRIVLASAWNDDRNFQECRTWASIGEVCAFNLPMQIAVCVIGQRRDGRNHGYWTRGYRHPKNKQIRFRRKHNPSEGFRDTWGHVWREDFDDISTQTWLEGMLADGVLPDVCFAIDLPVPEPKVRQFICDLAARKLEKLWTAKELPDPNLSTCFWPVRCPFLSNCHKGDPPSGRYGFVPVTSLQSCA